MSRLFQSSTLRTLALTTVLVGAASATSRGVDATFIAPDIVAAPGATVSVAVLLDHNLGEVQGWSMGLQVPPPLQMLSVADGSTTAAFNFGVGPDFNHLLDYPGEGIASGVIINFFGLETLPPGNGYELHIVEVKIPDSATAGTVYPLNFIETIGDPDIVNIIVLNGNSHVPNFDAGSITVAFDDYCYCDNTSFTSACGNPGAEGEGCANSSGVGARLTGTGGAQVSVDDLGFQATGLIANQPVLLFSGTTAPNGGLGVVFGDGLRCAGGQVVRLAVRFADAGGSATWDSGMSAAGGWSAGDTRKFQGWYRDPSNSPCGAGFNLTQGVSVDFLP